jgi:hypothetical protein
MTPDKGYLSRSHIPGDDPEPKAMHLKMARPYLARLKERTNSQL